MWNPYSGLLPTQPAKRRVFVSYHHHADRWFYSEFSRVFAGMYEAVRDNSVEREIDSNDAEYVMRKIREQYIAGTSCTIVLCGRETPWRKFVDWEIKATLDKEHGLVGVVLPTNAQNGLGAYVVPDRLNDNIQTGYAIWLHWQALVSNPATLQSYLESTARQSVRLIQNSRPLRYRNG
jgi:hypothetical protein